jgi:hypothetical protein
MFVLAVLAFAVPAFTGILATVSGRIVDASGLPLPGVVLQVAGQSSDYRVQATTDENGRYLVSGLEPGAYALQAALSGFDTAHRDLILSPGERQTLDLQMQVKGLEQKVTVTATEPAAPPPSSRVRISRQQMARIPGAFQAGSMAAVTEMTPSAVIVHDQLHVRGGHEVGYEIDGAPVPTDSIGTNLSLLFDPKDIEAVEFQRGAFGAEYGGRLYGVMNVVTRSGFERAKGGDAMTLVGQQRMLDSAVSYGAHTDRVAYFGQVSGNETDLGLTPPVLPTNGDHSWGAGAAGKLWMQPGKGQFLTMMASARADNYDIPGLKVEPTGSRQLERDVFANLQWNHAGKGSVVWSLTPYYHFSRVALNGTGAGDSGSSFDDRGIHYIGVKADWSTTPGAHVVKIGGNAYAGFLNDGYLLPALAAGDSALQGSTSHTGVNTAVFAEDSYRSRHGYTLNLGVRWDRSQAYRTESAVQPRIGLRTRIPSTPLTAHAYIGRFFQVPPLETLGVGGAQYAALGDQAFLLVRAERNTQWETGISLKVRGSSVDISYYDNHSTNFLDHQQLGESSVFLPVNIAHAWLRGVEVSVSSPSERRLRAKLVYSRGFAVARGPVTGGLGDLGDFGSGGEFLLDHDQRDTAVGSLEYSFTPYAWAHLSLLYGSGFLLADGPAHLPSHLTADLGAGFPIRGRLSAAVDILNLTNKYYFLNLSSEFNGTHVARPRTITGRIRVSF